MDHFILALQSGPAARQPSFLLSLYWIAYEAAGVSGHLAYLRADPAPGLRAAELVLTDAPALDAALRSSTRPAQWPLVDPDRPAREAVFARRALSPSGFVWTIRAPACKAEAAVEIEARWEEIAPPVFASGPARGGNWIASTLLEARRAAARIDGSDVPRTCRAIPSRTRSGSHGWAVPTRGRASSGWVK
jgi:hypothetical protein